MSNKMTQTEINKRIKQVTVEAEFRFKCMELATPFSKKTSDLIENATAIYNYAFHINPEAIKKSQEDANSSK